MNRKLIALLVITSACTHEPSKTGLAESEFVDSLRRCVSNYYITNDTSFIRDAILYCDVILQDSMTNDERYYALREKAAVLVLAGRYSDAFETRGESVSLLDSSAIERLEYMSMKCHLNGDSISAINYLNKAISECDKYPDNADLTLQKAGYFILLGQQCRAKVILEVFLRKHDNQTIKMALEDFDSFVSQTKDGVKILMERINQRR